MYSLKDHLITIGKIPEDKIPSVDIFCCATDKQITLLTNKMQDSLNCYVVTLVREGECDVVYSDKTVHLTKNDLYVYLPGQSIRVSDITDDYKGICLLISDKIIYENIFSRNIVRAKYYDILRNQTPVIQLDENIAGRLNQHMEGIIDYLLSDNPLKENACKALFSLFLIDLINYLKTSPSLSKFSLRKDRLIIDFLNLVSQNYKEKHDIGFYAAKLDITPIYLSRIVKEVTGLTVGDHIDNMLIMEASWLLRTTDLSIYEISEQLHFADQASFSKFFKRNKGMSPKDYR